MAQPVVQVALVSEVEQLATEELRRVAAAMQVQLDRDFTPIWNVRATISVFPTLTEAPVGVWPLIVREDIGVAGAAGTHLDTNGQPFALVTWSEAWSLTASHQLLCMLADP